MGSEGSGQREGRLGARGLSPTCSASDHVRSVTSPRTVTLDFLATLGAERFGVQQVQKVSPSLTLLSACLMVGCDLPSDDVNRPPEVEPVQLLLLAGQSNMEGYGPITEDDVGDWPLSGSLQALVDDDIESSSLFDEREDTWVHFSSEGAAQPPGLLRPGFGATPQFIGPELGLGERFGQRSDSPLVLFKSAVGGTTLGADWRPPSAGGEVGALYDQMIQSFLSFRDNGLTETFPDDLEERSYEVAAFVWLQGWNDQFEDGFVAQYEDNLVALVGDVRADLELPGLPAVIVEGPTLDQELRDARSAAIARLNVSQPGSAVLVETEDLVEEEIEGNFHFHFNAANYLEVGRRIADALP